MTASKKYQRTGIPSKHTSQAHVITRTIHLPPHHPKINSSQYLHSSLLKQAMSSPRKRTMLPEGSDMHPDKIYLAWKIKFQRTALKAWHCFCPFLGRVPPRYLPVMLRNIDAEPDSRSFPQQHWLQTAPLWWCLLGRKALYQVNPMAVAATQCRAKVTHLRGHTDKVRCQDGP